MPLSILILGSVVWLKVDSAQPLEDHFVARHGTLESSELIQDNDGVDQASRLIEIRSDSGLRVRVRIIRNLAESGPAPIFIVMGGHRTGSDSADLFGNVSGYAVAALDYPYEGPERIRGISQTLNALPLARQAFRDTPAAVSLLLDWLMVQGWVDSARVIVIGASLGVPFAALAAARDQRITGAILVHGAADNLDWFRTQIARRNDSEWLHRPAATLLHWLAYGPTFDTARNAAAISPRPVLIVGAREDERTPAWQTEALFAAAGDPKRLRWTDGRHVQPGRADVIAELLQIAAEERSMLGLSPSDRPF